VENVKCSGCAGSIKKKIKALEGVHEVNVNEESGIVTVEYENNDEVWNQVKSNLKGMGYPEKGKGNLVDKAKSYVSCASGKIGA
jgi:copper chaperone